MTDESDGIKAIIYLQSLAGITETTEQARTGWAGMNEGERETTMRAYQTLKPANGNEEKIKAARIMARAVTRGVQ